MNNKNTLYIVIAGLVLLNIVTLSMVWGGSFFWPIFYDGKPLDWWNDGTRFHNA